MDSKLPAQSEPAQAAAAACLVILPFTMVVVGSWASRRFLLAAYVSTHVLQNHLNMRVLIASTENVTSSVYLGNSRSMMITNLM